MNDADATGQGLQEQASITALVVVRSEVGSSAQVAAAHDIKGGTKVGAVEVSGEELGAQALAHCRSAGGGDEPGVGNQATDRY